MYTSLKKICLCTILNVLLVSFILVISFYLIRRLNRPLSIEKFAISKVVSARTCPPPIDVSGLVKALNSLSNKMGSIDSKLDYLTGFKSIKSDNKSNMNREVSRKKYPYGEGKPVKEDN